MQHRFEVTGSLQIERPIVGGVQVSKIRRQEVLTGKVVVEPGVELIH
jgi:hypothetical protein